MCSSTGRWEAAGNKAPKSARKVLKAEYTFPAMLDPGRVVHSTFDVIGIPHSFVFDRGGQLVTEIMDSRTEEQFLQMLRRAGLE